MARVQEGVQEQQDLWCLARLTQGAGPDPRVTAQSPPGGGASPLGHGPVFPRGGASPPCPAPHGMVFPKGKITFSLYKYQISERQMLILEHGDVLPGYFGVQLFEAGGRGGGLAPAECLPPTDKRLLGFSSTQLKETNNHWH